MLTPATSRGSNTRPTCCASVRVVAGPAAAVDECARVTRIVQNVQGPAVREFRPQQIAFVRSLLQTAWKQKPFLAERFDHRASRCGTSERIEKESNTLLDL